MNSIQRKSHGVTCVQRFNPGYDFVKTRVIKTGKFNWIRFTEWHIQITHPLEGKKYILSVEFARRLKPRRGMEFHAAPQMKSINPARLLNIPLARQDPFKVPSGGLRIKQIVIKGGFRFRVNWN